MVLPQSRWEQVSTWFTEEEVAAIHIATTGDSVMQKGCIVDEKQLPERLQAKLKFHFSNKKSPADVAWRQGGGQ